MSIHIIEEFVNRTANYGMGCSDLYDTGYDSPGDVFRACREQHGRCVGSLYRDTDDGAIRVGWVFVKRFKYQDCNDHYIQETWVTLYEKPPTNIYHPYHL